ncbi:hypothetical protein O181_096683 [Austropuccinia psidii MF-1]|uniref:Uncharacterized protein n=1 Tax=Austropuccinia psidii MF-1 TaxID=1389203 RepID=A0A9Q3PCF1_9BASI|nr:hypothetical protein [Austropuccinia psidii MF-1]
MSRAQIRQGLTPLTKKTKKKLSLSGSFGKIFPLEELWCDDEGLSHDSTPAAIDCWMTQKAAFDIEGSPHIHQQSQTSSPG